MMDLDMFRGVVPFVAVIEEGSYRGAALRLGVSSAAVSKAVQLLEARLGLSLLVRSPRGVTPTKEGELLFGRCREAVASVDGARDAIESARAEPAGELVVSVPFVAAGILQPALALLRSRYPRLRFSVLVTDRLSRLAEESVDVAVRVGPLDPAHGEAVARRLRRTRLVTVAAPAYLARQSGPKRPDDLRDHDCLVLTTPQGRPRPWLFRSGPLVVEPALLVDHGPTLVDAALAGLGVTQLFDFMAEPLLRDGRLVQLLAAEVADGPDISALCAPGRRTSARVRAAFEAFAAAF